MQVVRCGTGFTLLDSFSTIYLIPKGHMALERVEGWSLELVQGAGIKGCFPITLPSRHLGIFSVNRGVFVNFDQSQQRVMNVSRDSFQRAEF